MNACNELRFGLRRLRSAPGYTIAAVATLALAIGASTAIFSAVYAVLLKPMPIRDPGSLVVGWGAGTTQAMRVIELSYLDIQDLGQGSPSLSATASFGAAHWGAVLDSETAPVKVATNGVSGNFFEVIGAAPLRGRAIQPDDDRTGSAPVIVISESLWTGQFGCRSGDHRPPRAVERAVARDRRRDAGGVQLSARHAGVAPIAPILGDGPARQSEPDAQRRRALLLGRLRPGATVTAATAEATRAEAQYKPAWAARGTTSP